MMEQKRTSEHTARKLLFGTVKIVLWSAMTVVLVIAAVLICTVKMLKPERLTAIVENIANRTLDADVTLGRVELSFRPAFPMLRLDVDELVVVSHSLDGLGATERAALPSYADTLLTVGSLGGGVDLAALLRGEIALRNVVIDRPGINIVLAPRNFTNFDIYHGEEPTPADTAKIDLPAISIDHFAVTNAREIRYFNSVDSLEATVILLENIDIDGGGAPAYSLAVSGNVDSPLARQFANIGNLRFSMDGGIRWDPARPDMVAVEELRLRGAFIDLTLNTAVSFGNTLTIHSADLEVAPMPVADLMALVPEDTRREYRLLEPYFHTDATASLSARLTREYIPERDTLPHVDFRADVPPAQLHWGRGRFHNVALTIAASLRGADLDSVTVSIERCSIAGPATALNFNGAFGKLISNPTFDCHADGHMNLALLPPKVRELVQGVLSGNLDMDLNARGNMSMFSPRDFHLLDVNGSATGTNLYYLKSDTSHMVEVPRIALRFTSRHLHTDSAGRTTPTLGASLRADTAFLLLGGVDMRIADLVMACGAENTGLGTDTTMVLPLGGGIRLRRLDILSVSDSAGARIRQLEGHVGIRRYRGDNHLPQITLAARTHRISAGSQLVRLMLTDADINATTYLIPQRAARRRELRQLSDSLALLFPDLSPDSVLALAVEHRRNRRGHNRRRVVEQTDSALEIIDWGLSKGFSRYLNDWRLEGSISTQRARMFTPFFPLRDRLTGLDITFNNDSIALRRAEYKAGHSDMSMQGLISNLRRSLTGRRHTPLKVHFDISSDTLDINQLAAAAFAGSAFAERYRRYGTTIDLDGDEADIDRRLSATADTGAMSALLIPSNIDGEVNMRAANILYSDLALSDFRARLLAYDGAINLDSLAARSDAGTVMMSALYSAPRIEDIRFGMSLNLRQFIIERFLSLVPAVDSVLPLMRDFSGIINADIAATVNIDSLMNLDLPTLDAAVSLWGDSLAFIDPDTYRTIGKWLRFRDKADNHINHMSVQLIVRDNNMQIFPFKFDIDRYTLGVVGHNDLAMNFDYHISVLKSPLPFKFGVNVRGNPDKYKVRLGGAKYRDGMAAENVRMVDTVRVNLVNQIQNVFRRGVSRSRFGHLDMGNLGNAGRIDLMTDTLSHADSMMLIQQNMIPDIPVDSLTK